MTAFAKNKDLKKSINNVLMMVVLLFSFSVFSQSNVENSLSEESAAVSNSNQVNSTKSSSMEFVLWFMGSKQSPNSTISTESNSSPRNQIITSGLAPNRLLIKAFLKKAVNFESAMV